MFSARTGWNTQISALAQTWARRQGSGEACFDLTVSNPTTSGFDYDLSATERALAAGCRSGYAPVPAGMLSARQAVCDYYLQDHGITLDSSDLVLTVSTSEAYSFLFRLLCDAGDEVLVCRPSYPLFDFLADLDDITVRPVEWLQDADGWHLDTHALQQACGPRTRAVLLVHPNNPTGHYVSAGDRAWLDDFCAQRALGLIVDEVFLDYRLEGAAPSFLARPANALIFVLSGISKICALPQMKIAWIACHGPAPLRLQALARLDVIADTFLSLATPAQAALPQMLQVRHSLRPQVLARLKTNLAALDFCIGRHPLLARDRVRGGWYATLRVPLLEASANPAESLLASTGVLVHPGEFFGFNSGRFLVASLLTPVQEFGAGIERLAGYFDVQAEEPRR